MSDEKLEKKVFNRRETLKLATAVTALGVGLCASLESSDAAAASGPSISGLKLDPSKIDKIVLTFVKLDPHTGLPGSPLQTIDVTPLVTVSQKIAVGTYSFKLTSMKNNVSTVVANDDWTIGT
jgi:hypothetical protein